MRDKKMEMSQPLSGDAQRRADHVEAVNAIFVQQEGERHQSLDFPYHNGFITSDRKAASWCANRDLFIGFTGTLAEPEALRHDLIPRHVANRHAWDGEWYLCALDDDGKPIGARKNRAGRIFLNMQSWAQLGGGCDDLRWDKAWKQVARHLDTGWGLKLNWPAYLSPEPNVDRMSYMRPGICENAAVYTHGNAFMLLALLERGMADEALSLLKAIDPVNAKRPVVNQPNLYFNGCLGPDAFIGAGSAEHVWATGSAAWVYFAMTEFILGLRRTYDGIVIRPCFPAAWPQASITRTFRGTTYHVTILNAERKANAPVATLLVDGDIRPAREPLPLDGKAHVVTAILG